MRADDDVLRVEDAVAFVADPATTVVCGLDSGLSVIPLRLATFQRRRRRIA
jgi:hypothetical protein